MIPRRYQWLIFLLLTLFFVICNGALRISMKALPQTTQQKVLDLRFLYTPQQAQEFLSQLGPDGRQVYRQGLWLDMIYPLVYASWIFWMLRWLSQKAGVSAPFFRSSIFFPFVAAGGDYLENVAEMQMLRSFPHIPDFVFWLGIVGNGVKWSVLALCLGLGVLFVFFIFRSTLAKGL